MATEEETDPGFQDDPDPAVQAAGMRTNRSMPPSTVIPVLVYADVAAAIEWLCDTFGFAERWRAGTHIGRGPAQAPGATPAP